MAEQRYDKLQQYQIPGVPPSMFYIPNFISEDEETYILNKIPANQWITLSHRRLQALPARLTANNTLVASSKLPDWLTKPILERFDELAIFRDSPHGKVNHCLINEYHPGQGIMPHEDGAAYYPVVATVSLGGSIVLDVTEKADVDGVSGNDRNEAPDRKRWRIFQEPRSLLITTGSAYTDTLHGIAEVMEDISIDEAGVANWTLLGDNGLLIANDGCNKRTTRISLTYRDVLKESKIGAKLFGKTRT